MMSSGFVKLKADLFLATHPHVPPQSIAYEVVLLRLLQMDGFQIIQPGKTGSSIRVNGFRKNIFSQEEINEGLVELVHQPVANAPTANDVVVYSVEGHTRALLVKVMPLDLTLQNHTVIEYPQGKTYVLLNR